MKVSPVLANMIEIHHEMLHQLIRTVDGRNPANQLRLVVYPVIYQVLYIPSGAGFLPSTVVYPTIHARFSRSQFVAAFLQTGQMVHPKLASKFLNRLGEKNATEKETKDTIGYPGIMGILQ